MTRTAKILLDLTLVALLVLALAGGTWYWHVRETARQSVVCWQQSLEMTAQARDYRTRHGQWPTHVLGPDCPCRGDYYLRGESIVCTFHQQR